MVYFRKFHLFFISEPRLITHNETVLVTNLSACEIYMFAVGVVGPYGYGPLSPNIKKLSTSDNLKAPPKNVVVTSSNGDGTQMKVQWEHNCQISNPDHYIVSNFSLLLEEIMLVSLLCPFYFLFWVYCQY